MLNSGELVRKLLEELAQWLVFEGAPPVEWVVCGGAAMVLQGLIDRATQDVDVIGPWDGGIMQVTCIQEFPKQVQQCIEKVAANHPELAGMSKTWINLGPRQLAAWGLPSGYHERLTTIRFGQRLVIHLLSRQDLISLKLYAASDDRGPRCAIHFGDLAALRPTYQELDAALDWVLKLPEIEEKRVQLRSVIEDLGYDDLAYYV